LTAVTAIAASSASIATAGERIRVEITSSADNTQQPCYVITPTGYSADDSTRPLLVALHTWSGGVEQRNRPLEAEADRRGWIYLFPHFRGPNQHPDACGSRKAQQDILDAVAWARQEYRVDDSRIYLSGVSGGGHMTLLMVGRHPDLWAAASAWVGISDLSAWHEKHAKSNYGAMLRRSCGGAPGKSPAVDGEYRARSPNSFLTKAADVPVDIAAGVHDGHTGSVPIRHSLEAFNKLAAARRAPIIRENEIVQLSRRNGRLETRTASDIQVDPAFGREIHLRRHAGASRVTIFEGGHEMIAGAAAKWLSQHRKVAATQQSGAPRK
jgi:poly(3-hydroxybutyrate) depolymerase